MEALATGDLKTWLRASGLRATRQRVALCRVIFAGGHRHFTAESLHEEAKRADVHVALATVYNVLHQLTGHGLLREIVVDPRRVFYDTNLDDHHHFFYEDEGRLEDISGEHVQVSGLPKPPSGARVETVDVIVRLRRAP